MAIGSYYIILLIIITNNISLNELNLFIYYFIFINLYF